MSSRERGSVQPKVKIEDEDEDDEEYDIELESKCPAKGCNFGAASDALVMEHVKVS